MANKPDPAAWGLPDFSFRPLPGGGRNEVLKARDAPYVFKSTTRTEAQVAWLEGVSRLLEAVPVIAPMPEPGRDGRFVQDGWTMEGFVDARSVRQAPPALAPIIGRIQALDHGLGQRPGFVTAEDLSWGRSGGDVDFAAMPKAAAKACQDAFKCLRGQSFVLAHGDLCPSNLGVTADGEMVIFDWDEARMDWGLFDQCAVGQAPSAMAERAALAYEVACCWQKEPRRSRKLYAELIAQM